MVVSTVQYSAGLTTVFFSLTSAGLNRGNMPPPMGTPPTGTPPIPGWEGESWTSDKVCTLWTHVSPRGVPVEGHHLKCRERGRQPESP